MGLVVGMLAIAYWIQNEPEEDSSPVAETEDVADPVADDFELTDVEASKADEPVENSEETSEKSTPQPDPDPDPDPDPVPAEAPAPQPAPTPQPDPAPQPEPAPAEASTPAEVAEPAPTEVPETVSDVVSVEDPDLEVDEFRIAPVEVVEDSSATEPDPVPAPAIETEFSVEFHSMDPTIVTLEVKCSEGYGFGPSPLRVADLSSGPCVVRSRYSDGNPARTAHVSLKGPTIFYCFEEGAASCRHSGN